MKACDSCCDVLKTVREQWMTAKQIADETERDEQGVMKWCRQLEGHGILVSRKSPNKPPRGVAPSEFRLAPQWGGKADQ